MKTFHYKQTKLSSKNNKEVNNCYEKILSPTMSICIRNIKKWKETLKISQLFFPFHCDILFGGFHAIWKLLLETKIIFMTQKRKSILLFYHIIKIKLKIYPVEFRYPNKFFLQMYKLCFKENVREEENTIMIMMMK